MNGHRSKRLYTLFLIMTTSSLSSFKLGIENSSDAFLRSLTKSKKYSYRAALISNQTGVDQKGNRTADILFDKGVRLVYLLAPEHGFDGKVPAGQAVTDTKDIKTGIPIVSAYKTSGDLVSQGKRISPEIVKKIDVLFYDIQDSGMRHYTYISTLFYALQATAEHDKVMVVFDRPNLIGPSMEGPLVDAGLQSFISIAPIPLRHGMTVGEIACFFNKYVLDKPAKLLVAKMEGYDRDASYRLLAPLSPNLNSQASLYGYSFLGLLGEVEPFDTAIGTVDAFQVIALAETIPFSSAAWNKLRSALQERGLTSSHFTYFNTRKHKTYSGLKFHFNHNFQDSFALFLEIIAFFKKHGVDPKFSATFDKAVGSSLVQKIFKGLCGLSTMKAKVNSDLVAFYKKAESCFLYESKPRIVKI